MMNQETKRERLQRTPGLDSYIEKNWIPEQLSDTETAPSFPDREADDRKGSSDPHELPSFESLEALIGGVGKTFHELLFEMISLRLI